MIEMCPFICQVQTALGREKVRRGWNMALKKWIFYILSILPKLYLAQKPRHHNREERSTFLKIKGFQFTKTLFIMGLRNSWNRKVLNGFARKRNAGKSFFTHWFCFGCHPFLNHINLSSSGQETSSPVQCLYQPCRHGCNADSIHIQADPPPHSRADVSWGSTEGGKGAR